MQIRNGPLTASQLISMYENFEESADYKLLMCIIELPDMHVAPSAIRSLAPHRWTCTNDTAIPLFAVNLQS